MICLDVFSPVAVEGNAPWAQILLFFLLCPLSHATYFACNIHTRAVK